MSENKTALARVENGESSALAAPGDFGAEHMRVVREGFAPTATKEEFDVLWAGARSRRLDPIRKQIHFVKRKDYARGGVEVWSSQVSIDGLRGIAEATGKYDGQDEPEYEYDAKDRLVLARVRIYRKDIGRPFVGVARWAEYVQTKQGGEPTHMWVKMEHTMLAKCAEALGLRKAFPEPLAGLYTGEEMMQADSDGNVSAPRPVMHRPVVQAEPEGRSTILSPPPDALRSALASWGQSNASPEEVATIAGSADPKHRRMVFGWRIDVAETLEELASVATDLGAEPHEAMRTEMLKMAEAARVKMAGVAA